MNRLMSSLFLLILFSFNALAAILTVRIHPVPAHGTRIEILETGESRQADSAGLARFGNLQPDQYNVCIVHELQKEICKKVAIATSDSSLEVVLNLFGADSTKKLTDSVQNGLPGTDTTVSPDSIIPDTTQTKHKATQAQNQDSTYALQKVVVKGRSMSKKGLGKQTITQKAIKQLPSLAEPDVMRAIQLLPGVVASSDFSNKLYVRGGASDQNLILLDNAVVYSPSHFGGLFSTFAVDAIKEIEFYKGGFPARYGNRLSSVLDIQQRSGKQGIIHGNVGISLLSSKLGLEGTFPKGSWMVSGRRTYVDKVTEKLKEMGIISLYVPYYFYDGQVYVEFAPTTDSKISYTYYGGRDFLDFVNLFVFDWGNQVHAVNYALSLSKNLQYRGTVSYSEFDQVAKMQRLLEMTNAIKDGTVKQEMAKQFDENHELSFGLEANYYEIEFRQNVLIMDWDSRDLSYASLFAAFLQYERDWTKNLNMMAGFRVPYYHPTEDIAVEPRMSLNYSLTPSTQLMGHAGLYRQYLTSVLFADQEMPNEYWYALQGDMPTTWATMLSGGIKHEKEDQYLASFELYHKNYSNLPIFHNEYDTSASISEQHERKFWEFFTNGKGYSFGGEVLFEKQHGLIDGYFGYSLGFSILYNDSAIFSNWDKRHSSNLILNVNWNELLGTESRYQFTTSFANILGSGMPYTEIIGIREDRPYGNSANRKQYMYGSKNLSRYPMYWRTDCTPIRVERDGKRIDWTLYWQIVNLIDRDNVYMYFYDTQSDPPEREQVGMLPRIPIFIGFEMTF